jgi:hypothetical protein
MRVPRLLTCIYNPRLYPSFANDSKTIGTSVVFGAVS